MKIAFLGAGAMCREHAKAFSDIDGVILQGVSGRNQERAAAFAADFGMPVVASNIAELYEKTHADLVVIAVTDDQAAQVALAALKQPWAVFMEKPPGLDCAETSSLLEAANGRIQPVYVGLNRRFIGSTLEAQRSLSNTCGPRHIVVQDQQDLAVAASYGYSQRIIDQWMFANSIHLVDYVFAFARGSITDINIIRPWNPANPGVVSAFIQFDSGDTAIYEALWNRPGPWAVSVTTEELRCELRPLEQAKLQQRGSRAWLDLESHMWDTQFKPGFRLQAREVYEGVTKGRSNAISLAESWLSMQLVNSIYSPG